MAWATSCLMGIRCGRSLDPCPAKGKRCPAPRGELRKPASHLDPAYVFLGQFGDLHPAQLVSLIHTKPNAAGDGVPRRLTRVGTDREDDAVITDTNCHLVLLIHNTSGCSTPNDNT